jgi:hypothetical protein
MSLDHVEVPKKSPEEAMLPRPLAKSLSGFGYAFALFGLIFGAMGAYADLTRFKYAYLTGFAYVVTLGLGGLLFILIMHVTKTSWSIAARRQAEWIAGILPVALLLAIPLVFFAHDIYEWMHEGAMHDPILAKKAAYLNPKRFYLFGIVYFVIWIGASTYFRRRSLEQDRTGDPKITLAMQKAAAPAILLTALSLSFAGFDWLMSLQPHWYSTIFGVYVFSGAMTSALSLISLGTILFQRRGLYGPVSTVEHRHDLGKLLFGFTVFWTYIAFSQYFLIWYANIPEETIFYRLRLEHGWRTVSQLLVIGHFVLPFVLLLSRHVKRHMLGLGFAAVWMLFMHWIDLYWIVMPNWSEATHTHGVGFSWVDLSGWFAPLGIMAFWWTYRASRDPVYPVRDPRLPETVRLVQL